MTASLHLFVVSYLTHISPEDDRLVTDWSPPVVLIRTGTHCSFQCGLNISATLCSVCSIKSDQSKMSEQTTRR